MPNREKVIKGLECCAKDDCSITDVCPYGEEDANNCLERLSADALALLKEQEAVVRCKDCKHYIGYIDGYCEKHFRKPGGNLFFCADGKRK